MGARSGNHLPEVEGIGDLGAFARLRVAVVGDLIADHYVEGVPSRVSREAPVLVLSHRAERWSAGGAANVARNVRALGAQCRLLGLVGRDASARPLLELLEREGLDANDVRTVPGWQTPTKTRVLAGEDHRTPQQVLRIDREPSGPAPEDARVELARRVAALAGRVDALIVSDYGYGALEPHLVAAVDSVARAGARVVLDPRTGLGGFARLDALTPNLEELARLSGCGPAELSDGPGILVAAKRLAERARATFVLATLGNRGMALVGDGVPGGGAFVAASGADRVVDVSGAGDTAAAAFALGLAAGWAPARAMVVANAAAGLVVMQMGTAVPDLAALGAVLGDVPQSQALEWTR
ncbi:MAG: sugar kinase [Planctomycetaceae bacterium]|nr:sugar kinase [Planctomycetaceae bacterium]